MFAMSPTSGDQMEANERTTTYALLVLDFEAVDRNVEQNARLVPAAHFCRRLAQNHRLLHKQLIIRTSRNRRA